MSKVDTYRALLRKLEDWEPFLLQESGLPGPRGNLELARAVAEEGDEERFWRWLDWDAERAPTNSPNEFLAFCGVLGLGRLLAGGRVGLLQTLARHASDRRWRIREAVAMALQRFGGANMDALLREMEAWGRGSPLEKRAAAAALCEPVLLTEPTQVQRVLQILDEITASIASAEDRKSEDFRALRKGMGYCWSVVVAALPDEGKAAMEKWFQCMDPDVRWIMVENLKKNRLARMDAEWVDAWRAHLAQ